MKSFLHPSRKHPFRPMDYHRAYCCKMSNKRIWETGKEIKKVFGDPKRLNSPKALNALASLFCINVVKMNFRHICIFLIIAAVILFPGCSGIKKECALTTDCNASAMCVNGTCLLRPGCTYNNPSCESDYNCENNTCVKKAGCLFDNPPCDDDYVCANNECVKKQGCKYQNPSCEFGSDCVNNMCVKKLGCAYSNPVCGSNSTCVNNTCTRKAGCYYNNPSCGLDSDCKNNTCIKKLGCEFNNPACASDFECQNNTCIKKIGCAYQNPSCGSSYNCISNQCVKKPGCDYDNPPCNTGYVCRSNQCLRQLSLTEKEEILGLVSVFSASRNIQVQYSSGYGAEEACERFTGIYYYREATGRETLTISDAQNACQMINTANPGACGYPVLIEGTLQFGIDTFNMDNNLTKFSQALSVLTPENTAGKLAEAKGYVLATKASATSSKGSLLRYDYSCGECLGICPIMPYNFSALDAAAERLQ
jgi:hypothetical protein